MFGSATRGPSRVPARPAALTASVVAVVAAIVYATVTGTSRAMAARAVHLRLRGAPAEAQVLVPSLRAPRSVTVDGRTPPRMTAAVLRGAGAGWTVTSGPFGGLVLKVHTRAGTADVTVR